MPGSVQDRPRYQAKAARVYSHREGIPVITIDDEGYAVLDFADWTPDMMALASGFWDLPPRPETDGPASHEYGIDRLAKKRYGRRAIDLLHGVVLDLEYRPDDDEVVRLGRTMILVDCELTKLRRDHRRHRRH